MNSHRPSTLILGVGNILLGDEGIGVHVVEYLQKQDLPKDIDIVDGGTAGADLIDVLADRKMVIIIDAVQSSHPAGTILKLALDDLVPDHANPLSLHELDLPQTLEMIKMLDCAPDKVICFGIVPETTTPGVKLSQTLVSLVPKISEIVLEATKA